MKASEWIRFLHQRSVSVVGLGISNLPLIDFLLSHGARVTARDRKEAAELGETFEKLQEKGVRMVCGAGYLEDLTEAVIFRSPGLRPDLPEFCTAVQNGAAVISEMELFFDLTPATLIGITGSDGKTTTTTLTGLMLGEECKRRGHGHVYVGGNIGQPLLPLAGDMTADDFAVVELSSFQLQTMQHSPTRAAITNITPNHLNWHTDMEEYIRAKTNIYRHTGNRMWITNAENEVTRKLAQTCDHPLTLFSSRKACPAEFGTCLREGDRAVYLSDGWITLWDGVTETRKLCVNDILLPGLHNVENYMTAIALTDGLVSEESIQTVAKTFAGVPHRLEWIKEVDGVTYYNSSIDSSPTRTAAALSALKQKPIVICGGYDKKIPFEPLAQALCERAKAVVLTGATAPRIRAALEACTEVQNGALPIWEEPDFTRAVYLARERATPGDIVLLSPACASFDAFQNFEERGNTFRKIVESFDKKSR